MLSTGAWLKSRLANVAGGMHRLNAWPTPSSSVRRCVCSTLQCERRLPSTLTKMRTTSPRTGGERGAGRSATGCAREQADSTCFVTGIPAAQLLDKHGEEEADERRSPRSPARRQLCASTSSRATPRRPTHASRRTSRAASEQTDGPVRAEGVHAPADGRRRQRSTRRSSRRRPCASAGRSTSRTDRGALGRSAPSSRTFGPKPTFS